MRSPNPPPPEGNGEQIATLIKLLHDTGEQLEQITSGEVDAVTDAGGRKAWVQPVRLDGQAE